MVKLDLTSNKLTFFDFSNLPQTLVEINLSRNMIERIDNLSSVNNLKWPLLTHIDISHNKLKSLELDLEFPVLREVHMSHNFFKQIPPSFLKPKLFSIVATDNCISDNDGFDLSHMENLVDVDLSTNNLKFVPCVHSNLKRLGLSQNKIQTIDKLYPENYYLRDDFRSSLIELRLCNNRINCLPEKYLLPLTKLKVLDLSKNDLSALPYCLGYIPELQKLLVDGNPLR